MAINNGQQSLPSSAGRVLQPRSAAPCGFVPSSTNALQPQRSAAGGGGGGRLPPATAGVCSNGGWRDALE